MENDKWMVNWLQFWLASALVAAIGVIAILILIYSARESEKHVEGGLIHANQAEYLYESKGFAHEEEDSVSGLDYDDDEEEGQEHVM